MLNASRLIKELINTNWSSTNTGSRTPDIQEYKDKKRVNGYINNDVCYIYNRVSDETRDHISNGTRKVTYRVSIDVRTNISDDQVNLMEAEVKRIIRNNVTYYVPVGCSHSTVGEQMELKVITTTPFSNTEDSNYVFNYKRVIEVELVCYVEAV